jgi:hypothetical protein
MAIIVPWYDDRNVRIGWQVRIREKGYPQQTRTFRTKTEADGWAKHMESECTKAPNARACRVRHAGHGRLPRDFSSFRAARADRPDKPTGIAEWPMRPGQSV